jgi:hypothetical protein
MWTDGVDYSTGQLISATIWNNYLGAAGDIDLTAPGVVTTAGDVVYATGDNVIARLAIGNGGTVLSSTGSAVQWGLTLTDSITAGAGTQNQANATALTTMINRVTVSATDGNGVKLPTAVAGLEVLILNADSAETIQVWPNTSDTIDGGSANIVDGNALPAGKTRRYIAIDATKWYTASFSNVPSDVVAYRASSASTPSGWSEYTTARGRMVVGLVSGGTDGGTVGTALTNSQDKTHTHTGPSHTHILALGGAHPSESVRVDDVFGVSGEASAWVRGGATTDTNTKDRNLTDAGGTGATGTAATSDVLAYIQLMAIKSD